MELAYQRAGDGREKIWTQQRIAEDGLDITRRVGSPLRVDRSGATRDEEMVQHIATLLPHGNGDLRSAVLLLANDAASFASHDAVLLVNGLPPLTVTELTDRAEISLGAESLFYRKVGSTALEIYDSIEDEYCPRCKRRILQDRRRRRPRALPTHR